jgi:hypothetical protein
MPKRQKPTTKRPSRQQPPLGWTPEDLDRLTSWMPVILAELHAEDSVEDTGDALRSGSIRVDPDGSWQRFSHGTWGQHGLQLIAELLNDAGGAAGYARRFLTQHSGHGTWEGIDSEAGREKARYLAGIADDLLKRRVPVAGTPAESYLAGRGLPASGDGVGAYVPDADPKRGLGAFIGLLTSPRDPVKVVAVQALYVDPAGRPELTATGKKLRRHYAVEADPGLRTPDKVFYLPPTGDAATDDPLTGKTLIAEGQENAMALHAVAPGAKVLGLPGIGGLQHLEVTGEVIVMRDNDGEDAPATKGLIKGLDALLLSGAKVLETNTPLNRDAANYIEKGEHDALRQLLLNARLAQLSLGGEVSRLSRLDLLSYEKERKGVADRLSVRVGVIDRLVDRLRDAQDADEQDSDTKQAIDSIGEDDLWPEPVNDIATVLDTARTQLERYIVFADKHGAVKATIWALHAHFVHHETIKIPVSPRFLADAKDKRCGKTNLLTATSNLTPRSLIVHRLTGAAYAELAHLYRPTLFVDELDKLLQQKSSTELRNVVLSSHYRRSAVAVKMVPLPEGGYELRVSSTWLTIGGTAVNGLGDDQMEDRFITTRLPRASKAESRALDDFANGYCKVLQDCRRKFARWAADQTELPEVRSQLPDWMYNRDRDNWGPPLQIAKAVGGQWYELVLAAAREDIEEAPLSLGPSEAFLRDLRTIIGQKDRIWTETVTEELLELDDPSADWSVAYRGGPVTKYSVGRMLAKVLHPDKTQQVKIGDLNRQGVYKSQLQSLFARYLPPDTPLPKTDFPSPTSPTNTTELKYKGNSEFHPLPKPYQPQKNPTDNTAEHPTADAGRVLNPPGRVSNFSNPTEKMQSPSTHYGLVGFVGDESEEKSISVGTYTDRGKTNSDHTQPIRAETKRRVAGARARKAVRKPPDPAAEARRKLPPTTEEI